MRAAHPNGANLLEDYFYSAEGMQAHANAAVYANAARADAASANATDRALAAYAYAYTPRAAADASAAYGMAGAVSLAAFAGAYIIDKRRVPKPADQRTRPGSRRLARGKV